MDDETVPVCTTNNDTKSLTSRQPELEVGSHLASNTDDKVRRFLAFWTAFLMLIVLVGYLITRDPGVLIDTTVVGIAVTFVFSYYFKQRKE